MTGGTSKYQPTSASAAAWWRFTLMLLFLSGVRETAFELKESHKIAASIEDCTTWLGRRVPFLGDLTDSHFELMRICRLRLMLDVRQKLNLTRSD